MVKNKNSITNIYHTQILALLLKVCYNIRVTLNFNGYKQGDIAEKIRLKNSSQSIWGIYTE